MAAGDLQVIGIGICYKNILQDISMQTPALNLTLSFIWLCDSNTDSLENNAPLM